MGIICDNLPPTIMDADHGPIVEEFVLSSRRLRYVPLP